jgi:hypothetical protein
MVGSQVSISPIFYEQLFCPKVFCAAFICLQFGFVIFWQKEFCAKAAYKMLVKLTPGVVFTAIHFLRNFRRGPISSNVCPWQALPAKCNLTLENWTYS